MHKVELKGRDLEQQNNVEDRIAYKVPHLQFHLVRCDKQIANNQITKTKKLGKYGPKDKCFPNRTKTAMEDKWLIDREIPETPLQPQL